MAAGARARWPLGRWGFPATQRQDRGAGRRTGWPGSVTYHHGLIGDPSASRGRVGVAAVGRLASRIERKAKEAQPMSRKANVQVRRAYEEPAPGDGARGLVDRIWPRGLTKERARGDEWCKQIAPCPAR